MAMIFRASPSVWAPVFGAVTLSFLCAGQVPAQAQDTTVAASSDVSQAEPVDKWRWETIEANGKPTARHEATLVAFKDKLYLIGGRRVNPIDEYDPATNTWTQKSETLIELHHFQAVVVDDAIYMIGAMTGPYPNEKPLDRVAVYYPETDDFRFGHVIPETRRRGAAGAAYYDGKIYVAGGITNGHIDGTEAWFDSYDPKTGDWTPLADAHHPRDHFQSVVLNDKLYCLAGRTTSKKTMQVFELTIAPTDIYDLKAQRWLREQPELPTQRAGNMAFSWNDEVVVGGGESKQKQAHNEVEAYNATTRSWRSWPKLVTGRHGSGFAVIGDYVYTASGCSKRGGSAEITSIERLKLPTGDSTVE